MIMSGLAIKKLFVVLVVCAVVSASFGVAVNALEASTGLSIQIKRVSNFGVHALGCDLTKEDFGNYCSVTEIEAVLRPLQLQLETVKASYETLIRSNVELLCEPSLDYWDQWDAASDYEYQMNRDRMYGPCLDTYSEDFRSKLHTLFFPCSNPNTRFEQFFPTQYWEGYYDSVNRSEEYGGCSDHYFASAVGLSYKFFNVWKSRWSQICGTYKSLSSEYIRLGSQIQPLSRELGRAKSIPPHKANDCQWNKSDPTEGFLAFGKTSVDRYGYKFTCTKSGIRRTGRVAFKAVGLLCPEFDYPTLNNCWVQTSWGTSSQLTKFPKNRSTGKVIGTGWYVSVSGYRCTVNLYANFAYKEKCG